MSSERPTAGSERRTPGTEQAEFDALRRHTFAIAYRMTGSVADAEEIGSEAFLRLERARAEGEEIEATRAWLSTVTTRLAIDHMRSAQVRRERYVGPWLPEPLLTDAAPGPAEHAEVADSLSQGFLVLLETLSPVERAVFLLREVFGYGYAEIGETVGRGAENCRQIAARARRHVEARRPRFDADRDRREELLDRFLDAAESGDVDGLKETLTADVLVYTDGGGRLSAARRPFGGVERVALFMSRVLPRRIGGEGCHRERATVNGEPAVLIVTLDSTVTDVISVEVEGGAIATVRIVRNPDKLRHLQRR